MPAGGGSSGTGLMRPLTPIYHIFIVSFHLPIKVHWNKTSDFVSDGSDVGYWTAEWDHDNLISKTEDSVAEEHSVTWIGAITNVTLHNYNKPVYSLSEKDKAAIRAAVMEKMSCIPIFLDETIYQAHYIQCCKRKFHDIFHNVLNMDSHDKLLSSNDAFAGFIQGNQIFCDEIIANLPEGKGKRTLVWIHDYHLMLLPQLLRDNAKDRDGLKSVFFLHVPFPTSEIFRTLSVRQELLSGMLGADILGFHTFDHARHFLTSCKRFLGVQYHSRKGGTLMVDYNGRPVLIVVSHVGVEPKLLNTHINSSTVRHLKLALKDSFGGKMVIGSIDRLQRLKGIMLKLLAFERLLQDCPRWRNKVIFVLHGIRRSDDISSYKDGVRSAQEIKELTERINRAHGPVVRYKEHDDSEPSTAERVALWLSLDVMVSTPVMEGLNLFPLEYQYCHANPAGVVIVSEISTCARILNGALRVNCFDVAAIADAYDQALVMSPQEREARRNRDFEYVSNRSSSKWTRSIIAELVELHSSSRLENETFTMIDSDEAHGAETITALQHVMHKGSCQPIDQERVLSAYQAATCRVFFLDFGGTITSRERGNLAMKRDFLGVSKRKLSPRILSIIKRLCADPKNIVFIVSGNTTQVLSKAFKEILVDPQTPLGLVAHSGLSIRWGNLSKTTTRARREEDVDINLDAESNESDGASIENVVHHRQSAGGWEYALPGVKEEWAQWMQAANIHKILDDFTWRTGGSSWKQSSVTTTWDFRQADPEWGGIQANYLEDELTAALQKIHVPVVVMRKKNTVQLVPKGVSKGTAVKLILRDIPERLKGWHPDFALSIGDDIADEFMFSSLLDVYRPGSEVDAANPPPSNETISSVFTCTVGRKPTEAQYYIENARDVINLLNLLGKASQ